MPWVTGWARAVGASVVDYLRFALSYAPVWKGRATRLELIVTWLTIGLVIGPLAWLGNTTDDGLVAFSNFCVLLLVILPISSAIVRRLHDTGRAWWSIVVFVAPYVGPFIFLFILFLPGEDGENAFGPSTHGR